MLTLTYFTTLLGAVMAPKVIVTLLTVLGLVLADTIFGVLNAIKNKVFAWSKLAQFMETSFVPYVGGLLVLALFSGVNAELSALFFTIAATITVKFLADITAKGTQLFTNIQFQSPVEIVPTPAPAPQPVSPQTDVATNTPAAMKTLPDEPKDEPPTK